MQKNTNDKQYTGYFANCYVMTDKRNKEFINDFLDKFIPNRQELLIRHGVSQESFRPKINCKTADELIDYLVVNKNEINTIYWTNVEKSEIRGAICFFTKDGKLIVGIFCETNSSDTSIEDKIFKELQQFSSSTNGYIGYEKSRTENPAIT